MTGLALVCSGQGYRSPDMLDFAGRHEEGRAVLQEFGRAAGMDLGALLARGEGLERNIVAQPLAVATAMANWAVLKPLVPEPQLFAGYSVGEVSAWACARVWSVAEAAATCAARAAAMDRCAPPHSGMLAVRGIPVAQIVAATDGYDAHLAIVNEDDHAVLGGGQGALAAVQGKLEAAGAWTKLLDVQVPSHTPLLRAGADEFAGWLRQQKPAAAPAAPVVLGISGALASKCETGFAALARAVAEPIRWQDCMQQLVDSGVRVVIELGPGSSLSAMLQQAHPQLASRAVSDFRTAEGIAAWVRRQLE